MNREIGTIVKNLIQAGNTAEAVEMIRGVKDYHDAERIAVALLDDQSSTPELLDVALQAFLDSREDRYQEHGYWVHSLSHFTNRLWARRLDGWIKKFNEVAFKGANELRDSNCSSRLVDDFAKFAKFTDDPAEFHLSSDNLRWMEWKYAGCAKVRIEAGRFETEEAFLRWKLGQSEAYKCNSVNDVTIVSVEPVLATGQRLQELGADAVEVSVLVKGLLTSHLSQLEKAITSSSSDWSREMLEKAAQRVRAALAQ
ncbi:MAG: hypothetical protein KBC81_00110 [Candidatus Pacebacteria bacterium]|nr:hypothetical protein [Candidatus Paceibacterota bacterium]